MRTLYFILTLPCFLVEFICRRFNLFGINYDLEICVGFARGSSSIYKLPNITVDYLYAAEDHRNIFHFGIDQIAMVRAIYVRITKFEFQGASTVEQQFVRVATGRYEKTPYRKFREQILALSLAKLLPKRIIAQAYLMAAFYGHGRTNPMRLINKMHQDKLPLSKDELLGLIARLKYPEATNPSVEWKNAISNRKKYTLRRLSNMN